MSDSRRKSLIFSRRFSWRLLAFALLLYACADVSVLEYYEGNLSLGIISYRQIVEVSQSEVKLLSGSTGSDALAKTRTCPHSDTDNLLFDDNDCFCCTAHAALTPIRFTVTLLPLAEVAREPNFFARQIYSEQHSPPLYRPPRVI